MSRYKQGCDNNGIRICPVCGTAFVYNPQSIYKITKNGKTLYLDRYNCYRAAGGGWDREKSNINH